MTNIPCPFSSSDNINLSFITVDSLLFVKFNIDAVKQEVEAAFHICTFHKQLHLY